MPGRMRIAEEWNSFAEKVLPKECSDVQRIETRRAFYAGAVALWGAFFKGLSDGSEPTPSDLEMMSDFQKEFDHYAEQLRKGVA